MYMESKTKLSPKERIELFALVQDNVALVSIIKEAAMVLECNLLEKLSEFEFLCSFVLWLDRDLNEYFRDHFVKVIMLIKNRERHISSDAFEKSKKALCEYITKRYPEEDSNRKYTKN